MDSYYNLGGIRELSLGVKQHHTVKKLKQTKLVFGDVKPKKRKRKPISEEKRIDNKMVSAYIKTNIYAGKGRKEAISSAYKSLREDKKRLKKEKAEHKQPKIDLFFSKK